MKRTQGTHGDQPRVRVLICDDQEVVREGLSVILGASSEIEVIGTAADGAEALELVADLLPDVVLMDLKMPVLNGIQATRLISERFPQVRVLVLTTYDDDAWLFDAVRSGACGYLLKDRPRDELVSAITGTARGGTHIDPAVAGKLLRHVQRSPSASETGIADSLNDRERRILGLIAKGLTNAEIAERVFLSEGTVRNYVSSILGKLEVHDRTQAAVLAVRHGIVSEEDG